MKLIWPALVIGLAILACNMPAASGARPTPGSTDIAPQAEPTSSPTPDIPSLLTICMGSEPRSLFLYADTSVAARSLRQAIYDGPFDILDYTYTAVILERMPDMASGDVSLQAVPVQPGDLVVDSSGKTVTLDEGTLIQPAGCNQAACAQPFSTTQPVQMDQLSIRFKLRPGLLWSDGAPLTAGDSVYSFEVAKSLYPAVRSDLIVNTLTYQALDETTVEWRGLPGYRRPDYAAFFFTPLPRHAWGNLSEQELAASDLVNRTPLGWGAYKVDEWTSGDHISLSRNPNYFRSAEGLPAFDHLVFRFVPDQEQALAALLAGECDYLDETVALEPRTAELQKLKDEGRINLAFARSTAWEHLDFAITPYNASLISPFQARETRQAVSLCIDRQRLVDELSPGGSSIPDAFVPPGHPLANPDVKRYAFDPTAAAALLDAAGWIDPDGNPATPRLSQGAAGVPDNTPLQFVLHASDEPEKQRAAQIMQESLAKCGIQLDISGTPMETLYAPGPEGPIFGRNFLAAQFAWSAAIEPPCYLYTSQEIPGPYPDFSKGWGGANISGYSNPAYDQACQQALASLPDQPDHRTAHFQAQAIFAEDLPALPLYLRYKLVAMRPDLCGVPAEVSADSLLWNLEKFAYAPDCLP